MEKSKHSHGLLRSANGLGIDDFNAYRYGIHPIAHAKFEFFSPDFGSEKSFWAQLKMTHAKLVNTVDFGNIIRYQWVPFRIDDAVRHRCDADVCMLNNGKHYE